MILQSGSHTADSLHSVVKKFTFREILRVTVCCYNMSVCSDKTDPLELVNVDKGTILFD